MPCGEISLTAQDRTNRWHQVSGGRELQNVAERPDRAGPLRQLRVVMDRHEDHPRTRTSRQECPRRGNPVETGHHDVGDDHVGMDGVRRSQQGVPVTDHRDDVELRLEQLAQLFGDPRVILGEQDSRPAHASTVGARSPRRHSEDCGATPENSGGGAPGHLGARIAL